MSRAVLVVKVELQKHLCSSSATVHQLWNLVDFIGTRRGLIIFSRVCDSVARF